MKIAALALAALVAAGCSGEAHVERKPVSAPAPASPTVSLGYPLTTCVVSGEPLGEMGDPVVYMHEGTEVRFCCGNCIKDFQKDPAKYLAIIEAARKK